MAATYTPIMTYTVPSGTPSSVTLSSIPSTYTDLIIIINAGTSNAGQNLQYRFNGDSTSLYSLSFIRYGAAGGADTAKVTNQSQPQMDSYTQLAYAANRFSQYKIQINGYSNTNMTKPMLVQSGSYVGADSTVHSYRSTSAINSVTFYAVNYGFTTGSIFSIYGIASA